MGGNSGTIFLRYKRKGILYYSYVKSTGSDYLVGFLAHWSIAAGLIPVGFAWGNPVVSTLTKMG